MKETLRKQCDRLTNELQEERRESHSLRQMLREQKEKTKDMESKYHMERLSHSGTNQYTESLKGLIIGIFAARGKHIPDYIERKLGMDAIHYEN